MKTADDILAAIRSGKNVTNINNINNIKNYNNIKTSNTSHIVESNEGKSLSNSPPSADLLASPSAKDISSPQSGIDTLPLRWMGVKFDLFQNGVSARGRPKLTLSMSIMLDATKKVQLRAAMNSPLSYLYRHVDDTTTNHWIAVKGFDAQFRKIHKGSLRASKFFLPGKQGSVEDLAVFLYQVNDVWTVGLVKNGELFTYKIDQEGSEGFQKQRGIATAYYGRASKSNWISQKELGI